MLPRYSKSKMVQFCQDFRMFSSKHADVRKILSTGWVFLTGQTKNLHFPTNKKGLILLQFCCSGIKINFSKKQIKGESNQTCLGSFQYFIWNLWEQFKIYRFWVSHSQSWPSENLWKNMKIKYVSLFLFLVVY